ncbi:ATP-binding cassette domain-containing protein [Acinetobacter stercoris]|uniref:Putative ABC transporter ATP-binding protein n=1 Tax=Acinetobacter stercoris TaxID=2126983 RepID=A0A2U3MZT4_9GAMM|nr:ABC transporter ATP-binding protein [Acinetobacter stercoris]SPL70883.1 putative ABC transporter ATP-binding protein [Acinetobacter stercoris]
MSDLSLGRLMIDPSLAPAFRPALPQLLAGTLAAVFSGLAMLAALWCMVQLVGNLTSYWVILSVGCWLTGAALAALASWIVHYAEAGFSARLRRQVAHHITRLPATTLSKQGDQTLKRLVSDDIATLHYMVAHLPSEIAIFAVIPLVSIFLLMILVGPVALWVLLPGAIASLYYLIIVPHVSKRDGAARMQVMLDIIAAADDYARGIRDNRIYGQQSGALSSYTQSTQHFTKNMVSWVSKVATLAAIAVALLQAVATFAIAYFVAYQYDTMTLAATLFFSLAIVTPSLRLGHGLDYVAAGRAAASRLSAFLKEPILTSGHIQQLETDSAFEIVDASFVIDGQCVFDQLNYSFPNQSITAITGPSGVGKTSLLKVLAGLDVLQKGRVQFAKTDLSQLNEKLRHQQILFIPQGGDVLPATVKENLALSAVNADDQQLEQALLKAQLKIDLNTDATLLSGGEKQRVGIARAFLTNASVILLDEPTSALDQANSTKLMQQLQDLAKQKNKTIVMVTHDLALAAEADARLALDVISDSGRSL